MAKTRVYTIDLNFQDHPESIASYLVKHKDGAILVESGPGSTVDMLEKTLHENELSFRDITHVLLTHIHLDHAGASGLLAQNGAIICVHPAGAPHLINPEKLLASAGRIYGDQMKPLWGDFLPVPEDHIKLLQDEEEFLINDLRFVSFHTPGHAEHHICYLFEDCCFSGDVGGVRIPGYPYLQAPMPPPELHFEKWYNTISRLRKLGFARIAPTHYGIFDDPEWHLAQLEIALSRAKNWLESIMRDDPPIEILREKFSSWVEMEAVSLQLDNNTIKAYDLANPLGMSADGLQRYWRKYRSVA